MDNDLGTLESGGGKQSFPSKLISTKTLMETYIITFSLERIGNKSLGWKEHTSLNQIEYHIISALFSQMTLVPLILLFLVFI